MAINPALLIAAPMLQDPFVDNATDVAMSNGVVTCYQDNSRTTLKNWYYQTGSPGSYTYLPLNNPLTLSAAGTITDPSGNDTIPFYYPYDENDQTEIQPYYITVRNSNGQLQFTRQNFPFNVGNSTVQQVSTLTNYSTNYSFWNNIGTLNVSSGDNKGTYIIAPGNHDGFMAANLDDIRFIRSKSGATDTVTFQKFSDSELSPDITGEYYVNVQCTAATTGEVTKGIQIPISLHLQNLSNQQATITVWAQNVSGSSTISLEIYQFTGTGASSPSTYFTLPAQPLSLLNTWTKYTIPFTFPPDVGLSLGSGNDDAYLLQINVPVNKTFSLNLAKPCIYLGTVVPTNEFQTYDQVDAIINTPRTGDIRQSLNTFSPFGWVPLNDGTIGNASSNATSRANVDTWQLYNLIWSSFKAFNTGTTNSVCQMYNSSGSAIAYGASAYDDWSANNAIALTKHLGKVLLGTAPNFISNTYFNTYTASNDGGGKLLINVTSTAYCYKGQPITFQTTGSVPGNLSTSAVFYISDIHNSTTFYVSNSFSDALNSNYINYSSDGTGTNTYIADLAGTSLGEYNHMQLASEVGSHNHTFGGGAQVVYGSGGGAAGTSTGTDFRAYANTDSINTINQKAFNVVQPSTSMNLFMKL